MLFFVLLLLALSHKAVGQSIPAGCTTPMRDNNNMIVSCSNAMAGFDSTNSLSIQTMCDSTCVTDPADTALMKRLENMGT